MDNNTFNFMEMIRRINEGKIVQTVVNGRKLTLVLQGNDIMCKETDTPLLDYFNWNEVIEKQYMLKTIPKQGALVFVNRFRFRDGECTIGRILEIKNNNSVEIDCGNSVHVAELSDIYDIGELLGIEVRMED